MIGYVQHAGAGGRRRDRRRSTRPPDESALVGAFIGRVDVEPVRGSHLVDVTFVSDDPKFAADAVNTLIDEYVSENLEIKLRSTQGMLDWLGTELATQQKRVEESERALAEYREKENALSLDDKQNIVLVAAQPAERHRDARAQRRGSRRSRSTTRSRRSPPAPTPTRFRSSRSNAGVQTRADQAAATCSDRRSQLLERYAEKHPQVININAQLQDAQKQLDLAIAGAVQSVRNEYETAVIEEQTFAQEPRRRQERSAPT